MRLAPFTNQFFCRKYVRVASVANTVSTTDESLEGDIRYKSAKSTLEKNIEKKTGQHRVCRISKVRNN